MRHSKKHLRQARKHVKIAKRYEKRVKEIDNMPYFDGGFWSEEDKERYQNMAKAHRLVGKLHLNAHLNAENVLKRIKKRTGERIFHRILPLGRNNVTDDGFKESSKGAWRGTKILKKHAKKYDDDAERKYDEPPDRL